MSWIDDVFTGLGKLWPLWAMLLGFLLIEDIADGAYKAGYQAAKDECAIDRSSCGWR